MKIQADNPGKRLLIEETDGRMPLWIIGAALAGALILAVGTGRWTAEGLRPLDSLQEVLGARGSVKSGGESGRLHRTGAKPASREGLARRRPTRRRSGRVHGQP